MQYNFEKLWATMLYTCNLYNIAHQLYLNLKKFYLIKNYVQRVTSVFYEAMSDIQIYLFHQHSYTTSYL